MKVSEMADRLRDVDVYLYNLIRPEVNAWFDAQCRDPYAHHYLYFRESGEHEAGALAITTDAPGDGWELADPRRISPAWTREHAATFCHTISRRLPLLRKDGAL